MNQDRHPIHIPSALTSPAGTHGTRLLEIERSKASFSVEELKLYIHGEERLQRMDKILPVLTSDPHFDKSKIHYMSRTEKYKHGLSKEKRLAQIVAEEGWTDEDQALAEELLYVLSTSALVYDSTLLAETCRRHLVCTRACSSKPCNLREQTSSTQPFYSQLDALKS